MLHFIYTFVKILTIINVVMKFFDRVSYYVRSSVNFQLMEIFTIFIAPIKYSTVFVLLTVRKCKHPINHCTTGN